MLSLCARVTQETYRHASSWFPVVAKHQLQINSFTLLHLLFQLVLQRKKWAQAQINSQNKQTITPLQDKEETLYLQQRREVDHTEVIMS